ncbi:MAG: hypothetical protein KGH88_01670 [Thaumarchaeota archaeon]|nr:hypothetical protein [Nitrososphaerota archaeon]
MQRGIIIMIVGISMQIINWTLSTTLSNSPSFQPYKGTMGTVTIFGWILFFAGFAIRHFDKKKLPLDDSKRKPRRR